ncbi:NAD(P)/FAD-dependent oxidoreductase [Ramlibacter tataouinensis]|uniref:Oxidoreductases-like protein n=1 Tax=Ramlibacter tataouinensis (strain ATCC BAA-407 / DSM 14655 / LMG 21543 / TTB310) TaxID=365046 RepID=F5XWJ6_RAMTT|nr:NAD(P)/FAD-dependent oxidoreductase [Ramlibacter tataouinensis]AEG92950.1 oxidoreductases-like protein [Ramlibacter tataouinensis TTB310]
MERVDAVVVGAGVVGLAVARALAQAGHETIVLEAGPGIGQGVSSRNSEVIHAGLYYTPGSLKARLCVRGKELLYAMCASHGIGHRRCGKLTVANSEEEVRALHGLQDRAAANGVPVEWLEARQAVAMEPALRCIAALHSPSTGIVDSHGFMLALQGDLERAGGMVAFHATVDSAQLAAGEGGLHVLNLADGTELATPVLVNAASLHACALARRFDGLDPRFVPREWFAKGNYYSLGGRAPFSRLIYPAPADAHLGTHLTLDLGGQAKFGPDIEWLDIRAPEEIDWRVDPRRADAFYAEVRRYWPGLPGGSLQPSYSGVRPKIHGPHEKAPDFRIDGPALHGIGGLVNLFGIESPGLTSSLAIAEQVVGAIGR